MAKNSMIGGGRSREQEERAKGEIRVLKVNIESNELYKERVPTYIRESREYEFEIKSEGEIDFYGTLMVLR